MNIKIKLEKVTHAYSGKPNKCCCGCSGKHHDSHIRPLAVQRIVRKIEKLIADGYQSESTATYICAETPTRMYIAYFD